MREAEKELGLYYKATKSETVFHAEDPDPENIPLADYRVKERQAILDFLASDANVLVAGGMSATNKTHLIKQLLKSEGLHFYDLHNLGYKMRKQGHSCYGASAQAMADEIIGDAPKYPGAGDGSGGLVLDEGMVLCHPETTGQTGDLVNKLIGEYGKLIITGGGAQYTSQEQTNMIAELMPADSKIQTHPFELKPLNLLQTAELIRLSWSRGTPKEQINEEIVEIAAKMYLRYFRLARRIWINSGPKLDLSLPRHQFDKFNLRERMMPDECLDRAFALQKTIHAQALQQIADLNLTPTP